MTDQQDDEIVCAVCEKPSTHAVTGLVSGTKIFVTVQYCASCVRKERVQ